MNAVAYDKRRDILVVHRDEIKRTILAVDVRDELRHLPLELRGVGQRGRRHLDENDISDPLRVLLQELLERAQLVLKSASVYPVLRGRPTFCTTPLTTSSLSRPTMIFLPSYSARKASSFGWIPGRSLSHSHQINTEHPRCSLSPTHVSFATRSASTPTGQYAIDATCPATSIPPVAVISYPHTRTHDDVKCLEYEYV